MKRTIGLGIGGLLALVVGFVLPHLPDSAFHARLGTSTFQGTAAVCAHSAPVVVGPPRATPAQIAHSVRACATASDAMNLGAWLVVLGALALVVALVVLILGWMRRRPAMHAQAV